MLLIVAAGELLGLTLWFSATAAAPAIAAELGMSAAGRAWLTMAVQAGFVAGTLASAALNLADLVNARRLFAAGCVAGAAANALIPLAGSAGAVLALRFGTGAALACVYPPGLKIVSGWFRERRGMAMGVVVGALTAGTSIPHLIAWTSADADWRSMMWTSSLLALAGGALVGAAARDGPYVSASAPFDAHAIRHAVRPRGVRLATLGYLGHMWELYAMWAWMPAYAAASLAARGTPPGRSGSLVAFVALASGAAGCIAAGSQADRFGKTRTARLAMIASGACAAAAPGVFGRPSELLFLFAVVWGIAVVADSAQFSALVAEHSPRTHVGTALTLQTCAGFLLTMVSMRIVPAVAGAIGWQWAFVVLVPGPLLGAWVMIRLPDSSPDRLER
jgi:MFS family permease